MIEQGWNPDAETVSKRWTDQSPAGRLLLAVANMATRRAAASWAGISHQALYDWLERGREHEKDKPVSRADLPYVQFVDALTRAEGFAEVEVVMIWKQAVREDWRAGRDLLARRNPAEWGNREHVEHSGKVENVVAPGEIARRILENDEAREAAMDLLDVIEKAARPEPASGDQAGEPEADDVEAVLGGERNPEPGSGNPAGVEASEAERGSDAQAHGPEPGDS